MQYALVHFFRLYKSGHGIIRMFFFHIQALVSPYVIYVYQLDVDFLIVQRLFAHFLVVRIGQSLAYIQYHHRLTAKPEPGSHRHLWHNSGCEYQ